MKNTIMKLIKNKKNQKGQALIEMAFLLPLMIAFILGFLAFMIQVQIVQEMHNAVYTAALSASKAPLTMASSSKTPCDTVAQSYAKQSFNDALSENLNNNFIINTEPTPQNKLNYNCTSTGFFFAGTDNLVVVCDSGINGYLNGYINNNQITCSTKYKINFSNNPIGFFFTNWSPGFQISASVNSEYFRQCIQTFPSFNQNGQNTGNNVC